MRWYLGPWEKRADEHGAEAWCGPDGSAVAFDLRKPVEANTAGLGLFFAPSAPSEFVDFGFDWSRPLKPKDRQKIDRRCKGPDLLGCLIEMVTELSDPEGATGLKPLMNHKRDRSQIRFGKLSHAIEVRRSGRHFDRQREVTLRDLDELVDLEQAGRVPAGKSEQVLGYELRQRGIRDTDWKDFVGRKRSKRWRGPRKPETIISDDFDGSDESPLIGWTLLGGSSAYSTSSNLMLSGGANEWKTCMYDTPLSGSNNEAQLDSSAVSPQGLAGGPACRGSNVVATAYGAYVTNASVHVLYKYIAATPTALATGGTGGYGHTFRVVASGSTISVYYDGGLTLSATDTSISSGLYCGHAGFSANRKWDNFTAQDLGGGGGLVYTALQTSPLGVESGTFRRVGNR